MAIKQPILSLDRAVLIAAEAGVSHVNEALSFLRARHCLPAVTPTVMSELGLMVEHSEGIEQAVARRVLDQIDDYEYILPVFNDTERQVIDSHARMIFDKGILLDGATLNDARALLEAGYRDGKSLFLTTRSCILDANRQSLDLALGECGMGNGAITILSPKGVLKYKSTFTPIPATEAI